MPAKKNGMKVAPIKKNAMKVALKQESKKSSSSKKNQKKASPKKQKSEVDQKLDDLGDVLSADYAGVETHRILLSMFRDCLKGPVEERGLIHNQGVQMVESHMEEVTSKLRTGLEEHQRFLDGAGSSMGAELDAKKGDLEIVLTVLEGNKTSAEEHESSEELKAEQAKKEVKECKELIKSTAADYDTLSGNMALVNDIRTGKWKTLMDGTVESAKVAEAMMKEVTKMCKNILKVEDGMVLALPSALRKEPSERGTFDNMTTQEVDRCMLNWVADSEYKEKSKEQIEFDQAEKLKQSEAALERAERDLESASDMLLSVKDKIKVNKRVTREVVEDLKGLPNKIASEESLRDVAQHKVEEFATAVECFNWLKQRTEIIAEESNVQDTEMQDSEAMYEGQHEQNEVMAPEEEVLPLDAEEEDVPVMEESPDATEDNVADELEVQQEVEHEVPVAQEPQYVEQPQYAAMGWQQAPAQQADYLHHQANMGYQGGYY